MPSVPLAPIALMLVEPGASDLVALVANLAGTCFEVTVANSFAVAKAGLAAHPPAILVTELRLGEYNGLHLVLRSKTVRPDTAAIVLADSPDPVLQEEARKLGALFIVKPVSKEELIAAALRLTLSAPGERALTPPFERRRMARRLTNNLHLTALQPTERRVTERRRQFIPLSN
jgi:two-component system response regulator RegA